jgi:hypothetical protein
MVGASGIPAAPAAEGELLTLQPAFTGGDRRDAVRYRPRLTKLNTGVP